MLLLNICYVFLANFSNENITKFHVGYQSPNVYVLKLYLAKMGRRPNNMGFMLVHRLRLWPTFKTKLGQNWVNVSCLLGTDKLGMIDQLYHVYTKSVFFFYRFQ